MWPLIIIIVYYFNVFFNIYLILKLIITYQQCIQSSFRIFSLLLKSLHNVETSHTAVQLEPAPTQGARSSGRWNWGKAFFQLPRGMLSLTTAYQFLNTSTRRNMRPFEIWKISSWSRNIGFLPIPVSNLETVAKREKTSFIDSIIYRSRRTWSRWLIQAGAC